VDANACKKCGVDKPAVCPDCNTPTHIRVHEPGDPCPLCAKVAPPMTFMASVVQYAFFAFLALLLVGTVLDSRLTPDERAARAKERASQSARDEQERRASESARTAASAAAEQRRTQDESTISDSELVAFGVTMAQHCVSDHLKSPASAQFPGLFMHREDWSVGRVSADTVRVSSYVDSQNAFGAMIRSRFMVEVQKIDEQRYRCLNVDIR